MTVRNTPNVPKAQRVDIGTAANTMGVDASEMEAVNLEDIQPTKPVRQADDEAEFDFLGKQRESVNPRKAPAKAVNQTHPLLSMMRQAFGLKSEKEEGPPERMVGPFLFGFRHLGLDDMIWVSSNSAKLARKMAVDAAADQSPASLTLVHQSLVGVLAVCSIRTDKSEEQAPLFEVFQVPVKNDELVTDPYNPPARIRFETAERFLSFMVSERFRTGLLDVLYGTYEELFDRKNVVPSWLSQDEGVFICQKDGSIARAKDDGNAPHCSLCGTVMQSTSRVATFECPADGSKFDYPKTDFFAPHCHLCGTEMSEVAKLSDIPLR